MTKKFACILLFAAAAGYGHAWADAMPCGGLAKLNLPHIEVTTATLVEKGAFTQPANPNAQQQNAQQQRQNQIYKSLPAFCRVQATLRPTSDSEIKD